MPQSEVMGTDNRRVFRDHLISKYMLSTHDAAAAARTAIFKEMSASEPCLAIYQVDGVTYRGVLPGPERSVLRDRLITERGIKFEEAQKIALAAEFKALDSTPKTPATIHVERIH